MRQGLRDGRLSVRPSVRLSIYPIIPQPLRRAAGLLLSAPRAGNVDRQRRAPAPSSNGAAARRSAVNAGSDVLTAELTRLNTHLRLRNDAVPSFEKFRKTILLLEHILSDDSLSLIEKLIDNYTKPKICDTWTATRYVRCFADFSMRSLPMQDERKNNVDVRYSMRRRRVIARATICDCATLLSAATGPVIVRR